MLESESYIVRERVANTSLMEANPMIMCDICGKTAMTGHNVSHSKRRTNRRFLPNLQRKKITIAGTTRTVKICAQCLKTLQKPDRAQKAVEIEQVETPAKTPEAQSPARRSRKKETAEATPAAA